MVVQGPACVEAMATLIELGADGAVLTDPQQPNLDTPLAVAVRCGRADIISRLLEAGSSPQTHCKVSALGLISMSILVM